MALTINQAAIDAMSPAEQADVTKALAAIEEAHTDNPLLLYQPYEKQQVFHSSTKRLKVFFGGNRAGKTTCSVADDIIQAVDISALPDHLKPYKKWEPPFYCRIISPDFTATTEGVLFPKIRELVPKSQLEGGSWSKAFDKQQRVLRFANSSMFQFLSSEQDIDKFGGAALHRVHFDEEPSGEKGHQVFLENRMRLIDYMGDMVFSMTPLQGLSWTFDELWEKRGEETSEGVFVSEKSTICVASIFDNPFLNKEQIEGAMEGMSTKEKQSRAEGRYVHVAGLVYGSEYEAERNVVKAPSRASLEGKTIMVGIDPGIATTAIVFVAFDKDNNALVFDEISLSDTSAIPEYATKAIRAKEAMWGIKPTFYIIDPAARHRNLTNAEQVAGSYLRAGINTIPGQNAIEPGVFEVKRRFEQGTLEISDNCQRLMWELGRYRIDPRGEGFAVIKTHDHHCDALRYVCMARPQVPATLTLTKKQRRGYEHGVVGPWVEGRKTDLPPAELGL